MATDLVAAGEDPTDLDVFAPDHNELVRAAELFVRLSDEEQRVLQHYLEHRGRYPVEAIVRQVIPGLTQVTALSKWARWTADREGPFYQVLTLMVRRQVEDLERNIAYSRQQWLSDVLEQLQLAMGRQPRKILSKKTGEVIEVYEQDLSLAHKLTEQLGKSMGIFNETKNVTVRGDASNPVGLVFAQVSATLAQAAPEIGVRRSRRRPVIVDGDGAEVSAPQPSALGDEPEWL